jgi:hypothetical protein
MADTRLSLVTSLATPSAFRFQLSSFSFLLLVTSAASRQSRCLLGNTAKSENAFASSMAIEDALDAD